MLGPVATQLAPAYWLAAGAAAVGASVAGAAWGCWAGKRRYVRALAALDDAARGVERGAPAGAPAPMPAEIARIARSFDAMAEAADERERVLNALAMSDPETGLPNRRALEAELGALTASGGHGAAAAAVSIDGLATLAATIGHEPAVGLLNDVARRLAPKAPAAPLGSCGVEYESDRHRGSRHRGPLHGVGAAQARRRGARYRAGGRAH